MGLGSTALMPRQRDIKASYERYVGQNIDRGHEFGEMWVRTMLYVLSEMCLKCVCFAEGDVGGKYAD